jgi:ATP-binding cassette, subfamily B, bacterial
LYVRRFGLSYREEIRLSTAALHGRTRPLAGTLAVAPGRTVAATLAAIGAGAGSLLQPAAIGGVVDAISRGSSAGRALAWLAVVIAVAVISSVVGTFATGTYMAKSVLFLRQCLTVHALKMGPSAASTFSSGDLTSRLTLDTTTPATILPTVVTVAVSVATAVGALVALSLIDWRLTLTFLVSFPLVIVVVRRFVADAGPLTGRYRQLQSEIAIRLLDAHAGIRTIQVSGTEAREVARVTAPLPQLTEVGRSLWSSQRRVSWQTTLMLSTVEVAVLAVAGLGVSEGRLQPGQLVAAAGYVALAMGGFDSLDAITGLVQARVGLARVNEVVAVSGLEPVGAATSTTEGTLPAHGDGEVRFEDVTVRRDGHTVLDRVTLTIPGGASVAVVGRSGSGKSTLAALLGRLAEPDEGQVTIDGTPVVSLSYDELHQAVAYAFERPARLGTTVAELIGLGSIGLGSIGPGAAGLASVGLGPVGLRPVGRAETDETRRALTIAAARAAHADGFIRRLPNGYDTALERAPFSGGELQRLGVAQALSRPARVLVFDDATSSLDMATELEVMAAVDEARRGRTMLTVTQRVTTAARADLVLWLDEGTVKGFGPHRDLCLLPGYLATIAPGVATNSSSAAVAAS